MPDPLIVGRVQSYEKALRDRFELYLTELFFPEVNGSRQPIFTERLDEHDEYLKLVETRKNAELAFNGQIEPDFEVQAWIENRDGAQERLIELQRKFEEARQ